METEQLLAQLVADLDEAVVLLRRVGEEHWRTWLERARNRIEAGDSGGLDSLLSSFGGMGSFNDLILLQPEDDPSASAFLRSADDRLFALRSSIYEGCKALIGRC